MTTTSIATRRSRREKPATQPTTPIYHLTNPETPESIALVLLTMTLTRTPAERDDMLNLFAECLLAASGAREARVARALN